VSEHTAVTASCRDSVYTPHLDFNLYKMKVTTELDQQDRKKGHTDTGLILFKPEISQYNFVDEN